MNTLLCGTAMMDMDLPEGMDLTGFIVREQGSVGTHDPLKIRSLVLDDGFIQLVLIVCDLLGLNPDTAEEVTRLLEQETGIPAQNIILSCTHTHSGPASMFLQDCGRVDAVWLENLKADVVSCVSLARTKTRPCTLSLRTGNCPGNQNRIYRNPEEALRLRDTQVMVLEVRDAASGEVDTLLVNYPCHAVTLDADNRLFTKDYPHYMEDSLKADFLKEPHVIFTNGCCGDQNPIRMGSFEAAESLGKALAEGVRQSISVDLWSDASTDSRLWVQSFSVQIPLDHQLTAEALVSEKEHYERLLQEEMDQHGQSVMAKVYRAFQKWTVKMLEQAATGSLPASIEAPLKLVRIGKLVLVALPFEAFHDVGLRIKEHFGRENTLVLGYANGVLGYLPSRAQYPASQYEVRESYKYFGYPGPVSPEAEDLLCDKIFKEG